MTRPTILEVNCETQLETVREMNDEEYAKYLADIAAYEAEHPEEDGSVV